ncbi:hypothetical protein [Anaerofustis butyriciformans]
MIKFKILYKKEINVLEYPQIEKYEYKSPSYELKKEKILIKILKSI